MGKKISAALSEIRKQLWLGHASVMIGSGFSRNADRASTSVNLPPDWSELAKMLVDQLYVGCSDDVKARVIQRKSVLQLAQEFESAFQRPALNQFLKEKIADDNLIPNSLFSRLLELPWNDVFTTNYDTLLERAARSVMHHKYDIVYSCRDLAFSDPPRIIKLHGSFPSGATPLIVTEEDYRTYPKKFSPFVNTVQQTLMENILCLIGFSGTDPNFLQWIGWVRDNLGEAMPSIYLIGRMDLTSAERRVLESKRIIPVDLSEILEKTNSSYADAIIEMFEILEKKPLSVDWMPMGIGGERKNTDEALIAHIREMTKNRETYPNWIVLPWEKCEKMFSTAEFLTSDISHLETLPSPWDLNGLFELTWQMEKSLMPIRNDLIPFYCKVLNKYNPLEHPLKSREEETKWRYLAFAVFRWCREEMQFDLRQQYDNMLEKVCKDDNADINHLYYERVMWALSLPDIEKIDDAMLKWSQVSRSPYWNVRYASLLCELGKTEEAVAILEQTISQIRPNIPKGKIKSDYYLLNLEGIILSILSSASFEIQIRKKEKTDTKSQHVYYQRLEELTAFNCNPNEIVDRFKILMEATEKQDFGYFTKREFDVVSKSFKQVFGWPKELKNGYQVARLIEDVCMPIYIGIVNTDLTQAVPGCVSRLVGASSSWAFSLLIRFGITDKISAEVIFSQKKVAATSSEEADALIKQYVRQIEYVLESHADQIAISANGLYRRMVGTMFEIVSRLTTKASQETLENVLDLALKIVKRCVPNYDIVFKGFYEFFVPRLIRAMSSETLYKRLADLLFFGTPPVPAYQRFWHNPLYNFKWRGLSKEPTDCTEEVLQMIESSIKCLESDNRTERTAALSRLSVCLDLGICSKNQKHRLAESLCRHCSESGLPEIDDFYMHTFLTFLRPVRKRTEVEKAIRNTYLSFDFKLFATGNVPNSFSVSNNIEYFGHSIIATSSMVVAEAEKKVEIPVEEIRLLLEHLQSGFEASREIAGSAPTSPFLPGDDFRSHFVKGVILYDRILGEVLIPNLKDVDIEGVTGWLRKWDEVIWLPCARIPLHFGKKKLPDKFVEDLAASLASMSMDRFRSSAYALRNWCNFAKQRRMEKPPLELISGLVGVIGMRNDESFMIACDVLPQILKCYKLPCWLERILYQYIGRLTEDTQFDHPSPRFDNENRHDYRLRAAYLANQLYLALRKKGTTIPKEILLWKNICLSKNELSSIRRVWQEN